MANNKKNTFETKKPAKKAEKGSYSMTPDLLKNDIFESASAKKPAAPVAKPAAPVAAVKPAAPAPVAKPAVAPAPAPVAKPAASVASVKSVTKASVTPEQRYRMIEEAAYYKAEKGGFKGDPAQYWNAAEAEILAVLARK